MMIVNTIMKPVARLLRNKGLVCEAYGIWEESIAKTQLELRIHEATLIKQEEEEEKNKLH
ncbi:hypothetical protein KY290_001439 [Solanum tuberosum]|uniref:Uncharacterized protein n=1 Tax=Solanum tuberosum TaxID=4113 RepID=A0ABQ7WMA1_SOLTU|nr:hypothetical protein KY290_001439 [Solanum tuberosum]